MSFKIRVREEIAKSLNVPSDTLDYSGVEIDFNSSDLYDALLTVEIGGFVITSDGEKHYVYGTLSNVRHDLEAALADAVK